MALRVWMGGLSILGLRRRGRGGREGKGEGKGREGRGKGGERRKEKGERRKEKGERRKGWAKGAMRGKG